MCTIWSKSGKSRRWKFFLEETVCFSPFSIMLSAGLMHRFFSRLRYASSVSSFFRASNGCWILQRPFLYVLKCFCDFVLNNIYTWLMDTRPFFLHFSSEILLVEVYDPINQLLSLLCKYFIEFCIWEIDFFFLLTCCLVNSYFFEINTSDF